MSALLWSSVTLIVLHFLCHLPILLYLSFFVGHAPLQHAVACAGSPTVSQLTFFRARRGRRRDDISPRTCGNLPSLCAQLPPFEGHQRQAGADSPDDNMATDATMHGKLRYRGQKSKTRRPRNQPRECQELIRKGEVVNFTGGGRPNKVTGHRAHYP